MIWDYSNDRWTRCKPSLHSHSSVVCMDEGTSHGIIVLLQAIIRTGGGNPITSCNDDPLSTTPTCGWATDANGNNVYASQGFCCSCTSSALAAATLTSGTNQRKTPGHS